ncbi:MAG TPA: hypothetical protein VIH27_02655, partial [Nitrososphaerales archaeon]
VPLRETTPILRSKNLPDIHTIPDTKDRLRRSCQFPLIKHIAFLEVTLCHSFNFLPFGLDKCFGVLLQSWIESDAQFLIAIGCFDLHSFGPDLLL